MNNEKIEKIDRVEQIQDDKQTFLYWRGFAFTIIYGAWFATGLFLSFLLAVVFYPIRPLRELPVIVIAKIWNKALTFLLKLFCNVKTKIHNPNNIDFDKRKYIIASNHQSEWETLFMTTYFYPMSVVLKKELVYNTIFGIFLVYPYRSIPIDRRSFVKSFRLIANKVKSYLAKGRHIIIFPEGTRVPYGQTKPLSKVVATLAIENNTEILPIIHNAGKFWAKGKRSKLAGTIEMYIGNPISPAGKTADELMSELESRFAEYKDIIG